MAQVMMTVRRPGGAPTLKELQTDYGLSDAEIDPTFGVVEIDDRDHLYAVRVDERAAAKLNPDRKSSDKEDFNGPYSDPKIEPFGPQ
jgi:hypothetical protein